MNKVYKWTHALLSTMLTLTMLTTAGCSFITSSLNQAHQYNKEKNYEAAVTKLTDIIDSDTSNKLKAQAFMVRGQSYINLKEYRYAYRDLQVAWKLSCHIYQITPATNSTADEFDTATACIEKIPFLIDELKPFISEFGAIMATQQASSIVKKMFPELIH
ncbi:hypothetical protein [Maridesulfovibrio hydrothermalis]|uniref:Lipoprotein n=1 Tax=Maridesulfovibrio hydrothermalis AM13 = DSM 14728 TaxID=1121451 RepID=L0R7H4_9BACT|nr:hypothetical protein [Maridesulfovibrio hydrothermalis]CCO22167.1 conserved exported protein of unknown function [Maridesulfovibrio hydrothermalis AM13 = DSM 14728]